MNTSPSLVPKPLILAVEDHPATLALLQWVITEQGYRFQGAPDAIEALKFIEKTRPDLILLDIQLPHLDGLEFLRILRSRVGFERLPVIIISEVQDRLRKQMEALMIGADRYFSKPFDQAPLIDSIQTLLRRARSVTETIEEPYPSPGGPLPAVVDSLHEHALAYSRGATHEQMAAHPVRPQDVRQQAAFCGYFIHEIIGTGGMSTVYRATRESTGELVALKVLLHRHLANPLQRGRFEREAEILQQFDHPSIVRLIDYGSTDFFHYIAMELVDGPSLYPLIEHRRVPTELMPHLVQSLAEPIVHLHERRLVHRDIKPSNYLIQRDLTPKLSDFGLVMDETSVRITQHRSLLGSFAYMSPEQKRDPSAVDHRADIYSFAVTLYELLVGDLPDLHYIPPHEVEPSYSPMLQEVFAKAFDPDPLKRQTSIAELRDEVLAGLPPMVAPRTEHRKILADLGHERTDEHPRKHRKGY